MNEAICAAIDTETGEYIKGGADGRVPTKQEMQARLDKGYDALPWYRKIFKSRPIYTPEILDEKELWENPQYAFKFPIWIDCTRYGQKIYDYAHQDVEVYEQINRISGDKRYFCYKQNGNRLFLDRSSFSGQVRAIDGRTVADHFLRHLI